MHQIGKSKSRKIGFFATIIAFIMRLVFWTSRLKVINREPLDEVASKGPVIFVLWHGRFFPYVRFGNKFYPNTDILTSYSDDGELLSRIIRKFGADVVRGDDRRGGVEGLIKMIRQVKAGRNVIFAADGPLGPRHKLKAGVVS